MTAPDPGLTDLIAAHTRLGAQQVGRYLCLCGWVGDYHDHPAHVALVVEQHTTRRIAELEAENMRLRAELAGADEDVAALRTIARAALEGEQQ